MPRRVFVTGLGIISGLGRGKADTLYSLRKGISGIGQLRFLNTVHREFPVSEVKNTNEELKEIICVEGCRGFTRTAILGMIAARDACMDSGFDRIEGKSGIFNGTTVGGMDRSEEYYYDFLNNDSKNVFISSHDCGDSTERIAHCLNIKDHISTISTACSSSANAIMYASEMIKAGYIDRAIAGGTDSLAKFTLNGFNTLMILDKEHCKPFDKNRNGLNLGEGAAYLVLESEDSVKNSEHRILCELKGYGNANDAYHQTASSPEGDGAFMAMNLALKSAGLKPEDIDYINAHGTATPNNDISEGKAIERLFGEKLPKISSTKSFTGHTLGAAGALEEVISVLTITEQMIFKNLNFKDKIDELKFSPVTENEEYSVKNVISNSFGFGGNNTSLIFSRI